MSRGINWDAFVAALEPELPSGVLLLTTGRMCVFPVYGQHPTTELVAFVVARGLGRPTWEKESLGPPGEVRTFQNGWKSLGVGFDYEADPHDVATRIQAAAAQLLSQCGVEQSGSSSPS